MEPFGKHIWNRYNDSLKVLAEKKHVQLPFIPSYATNNAHMYYMVCNSVEERSGLIEHLKSKDIHAVFHYISLHDSQFYKNKHDGRSLPNCDRYSECLVRLPLYYELTDEQIDSVTTEIKNYYNI